MSLEILSWRPCHGPVSNVTIQSSRSNRHDPIGTIHQALWCGTARSSLNVRPSCINIGSATPLKGLFVWIDDACEQHGSAAAAPISQTKLPALRMTTPLTKAPYAPF